MTIKTKLFVGTAVIQKELGLIKSASAKLDQRIQVAGLSILAHINEHHNITLFTELLESMGKGHRKAAMIEWAMKFGQISQNLIDGKLDKETPYKWDKLKTTDMVGAEEMPWFDCKPEKLDEVVDFQKMLMALIKKATKEGAKLADGQEDLVKRAQALLA